MSELILVRHGQASFGKASYDKLSDKGIEQAKVLCRHWQRQGEAFDYIYSGSLLRQRETAQELLSLVSGKPKEPTVNPDFNEYNGDPLIRMYLRDHAASDGLHEHPPWPIQDERVFQQLFERATALWIAGELKPQAEDTSFEAFADFQHRVYRGLDALMAKHQRGSRVVLSTSGGVIAMTLQRVLQFPDERVIETNWMVHNSSVTRLRYGGGKLSLMQFNNVAHLEDPALQELLSYR